MSKIDKVFVRSIRSIKMKNDVMYEELLLGGYREVKIPLVYQYSQKSVNPRNVNIDPEDVIGEVVAIYQDEDCVWCDVVLNDIMAKTAHFDKMIDNFTIKVTDDNRHRKVYEFVQFIVYDKDFKRKVDAKCLKMKEEQTPAMTSPEQVRQNHYNR